MDDVLYDYEFGVDLQELSLFGAEIGGDAQVAFSLLPSDIQAKLSAAGDSFQQAAVSAAPFIDIASSVSSGKGVTPEQAVAGISAVATAIGGPIGGAAMAAAGGLVAGIGIVLTNLFDALGLYDHPKTYTYVGLRPNVAPIPYGINDPEWWKIDSTAALMAIMNGNIKSPVTGQVYPPVSGNHNYIARGLLWQALNQMQTPGSTQLAHSGAALNPFERYFLPILIKDLEMWANGSGYVPTRKLLAEAAAAWNNNHGSSPSITYQPAPMDQTGALNRSVVEVILGPYGDLNTSVATRAAPLTINLGPPTVSLAAIGALAKRVTFVPPPAPAPPPKPKVVINLGTALSKGSVVTPMVGRTALFDPNAPAVPPPAPAPPPPAGPPVVPPPVVPRSPVAAGHIEPWWMRFLPFAPAAVGLAAFPLVGPLGPVVGGVGTALWISLGTK